MSAAEIAVALGSAHRSGAWWRCRCPVHNSRGSTLALRDGNASLIAVCHAGCSRADIIAELQCSGLLGDAPDDRHHRPAAIARVDDRDSRNRRIEIARQLWDRAQNARGTPVDAYLRARHIIMPMPPTLCYVPSLRRSDGASGTAMVARVDDVDGRLIGVHRTWLARDGGGIWRRRDRASLGPIGGGGVWLAPAAETLMVGEGIETCLAAMQACRLPGWAALSTSGLVSLLVPSTVRQVIILADHDVSGAGERAAHAAATRLLHEGRRVRVVVPPRPGSDMADVLAGRGHARIAEACDAAA